MEQLIIVVLGQWVWEIFSGTVANTINQLPASTEPDKPGIKELLEQLKTAIEAEPNLSDKDKAKALKQVEVIAESGKASEKGVVQDAVDNAVTMLKGIISGLPATAKLIGEFHTVLPLIAGLFGL